MGTVTPLPGLRERKKASNRRRVAGVAFQLFLERGFDAVTVADVAAAAEVSVTTLFSYFPTKESLVFDVEQMESQALVESVRSRPPGTSVVAAVEAHAVRAVEASFAGNVALRPLFVRLLVDTPSIQLHMHRVMQQRWQPDLAAALLESVPGLDELDARLYARQLICAVGTVPLFLDVDVVPRIFAPLREGLGSLGA